LLHNSDFDLQTILSRCPKYSPDVIPNLRLQFDKVFQQGLHLQDKKTKQKALGHKRMASDCLTPNRVTLDDALVECFSTLSPKCKDEELEDMVYFILDLYQFYGIPVVVSEIDVDQVVVDLRTVLEEHAAKMAAVAHKVDAEGDDEHMFLILDKSVQSLPWESIPILRGRSVSRIPNVDFLLDRLELSRWQMERFTSGQATVNRAVINPRKGYYILNPSGDLSRTQDFFKDWVKEMGDAGWDGISGKAPTELQMQEALKNNDLVMCVVPCTSLFSPDLFLVAGTSATVVRKSTSALILSGAFRAVQL
jgi:separase